MATRTVVFDMDGTLVQSRGAAWEVFQDTVREFDLAMSSAEEFYDLFRDNFFAGLNAFVGDPVRSRGGRRALPDLAARAVHPRAHPRHGGRGARPRRRTARSR